MTVLNSFLPYLSIVLSVCVVVGGLLAVRYGKRTELVKFQKDTIDALKERIETLESKIRDLEKKEIIHQYVIDTITAGLKQRGIIITIDGDLVTIADKEGRTTHRKRVPTPSAQGEKPEKKEENKNL